VADGRTVWWPKDAAWWRREYVVALGEEFGAAGPAVLDWLSCEAKSQNDGGWVKAGVRSCARGAFVDVVTIGHVLSRAVTLGALDEFEEKDGRFECRISGWEADNTRGLAAVRQARARSRKPEPVEESRRVTPRHAASREITGQDSTEDPPKPPKGGVTDDSLIDQEFEQWLEHHSETTGEEPPGAQTKARQEARKMFRARRAEGTPARDLCFATIGAFNDEHRRKNGYYDPISVLRPTRVHGLIQKGKRHRAGLRAADGAPPVDKTDRRLEAAMQ
jgi:hypothetical protein